MGRKCDLLLLMQDVGSGRLVLLAMFVHVLSTHRYVNKSSWAFLYYYFDMLPGPKACEHDANRSGGRGPGPRSEPPKPLVDPPNDASLFGHT